MHEFSKSNINANEEVITKVIYDQMELGTFRSDIIVDNKIIIELKSIDQLITKNEAQLLTYLKISKLKVGLLLNFGNTYLEYKRLII